VSKINFFREEKKVQILTGNQNGVTRENKLGVWQSDKISWNKFCRTYFLPESITVDFYLQNIKLIDLQTKEKITTKLAPPNFTFNKKCTSIS
jgi:hypothetical protein